MPSTLARQSNSLFVSIYRSFVSPPIISRVISITAARRERLSSGPNGTRCALDWRPPAGEPGQPRRAALAACNGLVVRGARARARSAKIHTLVRLLLSRQAVKPLGFRGLPSFTLLVACFRAAASAHRH